MDDKRDNLYQTTHASVKPFEFDEQVARVFTDMISRSVPSYQPILRLLPTVAKQFYISGHYYYDLGCSLGAGLHAMAQGLAPQREDLDSIKLTGIDTSNAMLKQAQPLLPNIAGIEFELHNADISNFDYQPAALFLLNFTLQFLPIEQRAPLLKKLFNALSPNGAIIVSEKLAYECDATQQLLTDIHHQYKADQGYSALEIAQKRDAIENVLIPETLDVHINRLKEAGFKIITPWLQNLQFVSILAVK